MVRGQVEMIFILVLIIIGIVTIFYAFQSGLIGGPPAPPTEAESVKLSVEAFIQEGLQQVLDNVSRYGGYPERQYGGSVLFLDDLVPYWLASGQVTYPDLEASIIQGLSNWLTTYKASFEESLRNETRKNVTLGVPLVSGVSIKPNRIDVQVNLPTRVDGKEIPQPYEVGVDTKLGEIYEFAKKFVDWEKDERFLEYALLSSMALSPYEDGMRKVPFIVMASDCGDFIFKSWYDLKPAVEEVIRATLAGIYMPGKAPENVAGSTSYPKYTLPEFDGKDYSDLRVSFHLPDAFSLTYWSFQFKPNPILVFARPTPFGLCMPDAANVSYLVEFPAVVDIKDELTGNHFRFAVHVYIKDNKPAEWGAEGYVAEEQQAFCESASCLAEIRVKDEDGNPVPYTYLTFMSCPLGQTDESGTWSGVAPCGSGWIEAYRQGFDSYSEPAVSSELVSKEITLKKKRTVNLHVYEVVVQNLSQSRKYAIYPTSIFRLGEGHTDQVILALQPVNRTTMLQTFYLIEGHTIPVTLTAGPWTFWAYSLENGWLKGGAGWDLNITAGVTDLWLYAPYMYSWPSFQNQTEESLDMILTFTRLYEKCGLPLVSTQPVQVQPCEVGWEEV
ncbi:MAG: hypothetical protein DRP12_01000 [Candidatus Aenigmatarchaeota archaeon]|nr:MAG: hypothetical protein DRP12_01000 [Candidatus Aenigmarchaeota archaeon]